MRRIGAHAYLPLGRRNVLPDSAPGTIVPKIRSGQVARPRMKWGSLHRVKGIGATQ